MNRKWTFEGVLVACALAAVFLASCPNAPAATIELRVVERQGVARRGEPVTFAVPFPKGELRSAEQVRLLRDGSEVPAQFRATGLWRPEASIRWLLVDFQTDIAANAQQTYTLEYGDGISATAKPAAAVRIEESDDAYTVDTGAARFRISRKVFDLFHEVRLADGTIIVPRPDAAQPRSRRRGARAEAAGDAGHPRAGEQGPLAPDLRGVFSAGRAGRLYLAIHVGPRVRSDRREVRPRRPRGLSEGLCQHGRLGVHPGRSVVALRLAGRGRRLYLPHDPRGLLGGQRERDASPPSWNAARCGA